LPGADDWLLVGAVLLTDPVVLVTGSVTVLMMDPRAPVTGSVTAWRAPDTVDVMPDSGDGWSPVAACACVAGSERSRQTPPAPDAIRAARTTARRVFGFGIGNSRRRETRAWHARARPWGTM
jgi:hypothetical protein